MRLHWGQLGCQPKTCVCCLTPGISDTSVSPQIYQFTTSLSVLQIHHFYLFAANILTPGISDASFHNTLSTAIYTITAHRQDTHSSLTHSVSTHRAGKLWLYHIKTYMKCSIFCVAWTANIGLSHHEILLWAFYTASDSHGTQVEVREIVVQWECFEANNNTILTQTNREQLWSLSISRHSTSLLSWWQLEAGNNHND